MMQESSMVIVCDIDGVLADITEFYHLIPDWDEYYKHTLDMLPIHEMIMLVSSLARGGHKVIFVTSRPLSDKSKTVAWLMRHVRPCDPLSLLMRPVGDIRPSAELKMGIIRELKPSLVIDDDPEVVEAARIAGFTVLQVHGYRMSATDSIPYGPDRTQEKGT